MDELEPEDVALEKLIYESQYYQAPEDGEDGLWVPEDSIAGFLVDLEEFIATQTNQAAQLAADERERVDLEGQIKGAEQMRDRIGPVDCGPHCSQYECEAEALLHDLKTRLAALTKEQK